MANCDNLFKDFNKNLEIPSDKKKLIKASKEAQRTNIKKYFKENHSNYTPDFWIQGSSKMGNRIRTKDETCDLDYGIYFKSNPDNVNAETLQSWVKKAVDGTTDATPTHKKKCIAVDYMAGYNIDFSILIFDKDVDQHPKLAVKGEGFILDDPKEFIEEYNQKKDIGGQMVRITRYLKAWCDNKREKMPNGLTMTVLAMKYLQKHEQDDIALKFTLIEIENALIGEGKFHCYMPTTPNDDLFKEYDDARTSNFMSNLSAFITDAKKAIDQEKNQLKASKLWQKHLGSKYFPEGKDEDEKENSAELLDWIIGTTPKPYCD